MKKQLAGTIISRIKVAGIALIATGALAMSAGAEETYTPGTNMDDAAMVPLDEKIYGKTSDGLSFWYCFEAEEAGNYVISAVNKTFNVRNVAFALYDDLGSGLVDMEAGTVNGWIKGMTAELLEGQTYYLKVNTDDNYGDVLDYVFVVEKEGSEASLNTLQADTGNYAEEGTVPGINMDDAIVFPVNEKFTGKTANGCMNWYLFQTGGEEESEYALSVINKTAGGRNLQIYVTDENGNELGNIEASGSGKAATLKSVLLPGSIYYVGIRTDDNYSDELDYSITIKGAESSGSSQPAAQDEQADAAEETDDASDEDPIFN